MTQAWRQPGSSFKPPSSTRLRWKGRHARDQVNDGPLYFSAGVTGGQPWEPKNYDGKFEGSMSVHRAGQVKNMVSIRILQTGGARRRRNGSRASASTPTSIRPT